MDTISDTKPPPRPAATVDAETVAMQAQVLEVGAIEKGMAKDTVEGDEKNAKDKKGAPDNGLKNYFVRTFIPSGSSIANKCSIASLLLRHQTRLLPNHSLLSHVHWIGHHHTTDEHHLR
jgi:hypothetical protein